MVVNPEAIHMSEMSPARGSACTRYPHEVAMCLPNHSEPPASPLEVRRVAGFRSVRATGQAGAGSRRYCTGWKMPPGRPSLARPGV